MSSRLDRFLLSPEAMRAEGASPAEAAAAHALGQLLGPGLKINEKDRVMTDGGDKTQLGLYRYLRAHVDWKAAEPP